MPQSRIEQLLAEVDWVRDLARRLLGDAREADVDDVVQDTMMRAMATPPEADGPVRGWLVTVMQNVFRQRGRAARRRAIHEARAQGPSKYPSPAESVELAESQHAVVGAVLALPEPYRHTMIQRYFDGLTEREIAEAAGISRSTVQSRLRRGSELLREDLRERIGEGWAAAILPLALWPKRPPAPPTPLTAAPRAIPVGAVAVVGLLIGVTVCSLWWGDWSTKMVDPAPGVTAVEVRNSDTARAHVSGRPLGATEDQPRDGDVASAVPGNETAATAAPTGTPEGAIRVRVEGLAIDEGAPALLLVQPLPVRLQTVREHGMAPSRSVAIETALVDLDLRRLFGDDLDILDVDVTLLHPDVVPRTMRSVPAGPGDSGVDAVFDVSPAALVTGRILGPDGAPVAGASVLAGTDADWLRAYSERSVVDETTTQADGRFRLRVPPGVRIAVLARAAGFDAGWRDATALGPGEEVAIDVDLGVGETITGRVLLPPGERADGLRVVAREHRSDDYVFQGRQARALLEDGHAIQTAARAAVSEDGTFVLRGLSRWEYRVSIEHPGRSETARARESALVVCNAPYDGLELEQRLVPVNFVVQDADGVPVSGARVSTLDSAWLGADAVARTSADGRATIELRRGMTFRWVVNSPGLPGRSGSVATPASGSAAEIAVALQRPLDATWRVRIEDRDGRPVRDAAFEVYSAASGDRVGLSRELTSPSGEFAIEGLPRGLHEITIRVGASWYDARSYWHDVIRTANLPNDGAVETIVLGSDVPPGGRLRLLPRADDCDLAFGRVTLTRDGRDVPCVLAARQFAAGKTVSSSLSTGRPNDVFPVLEPGTYEIRIERINAPPCPEIRRSVTIREGRVTDLEVDLTPR